MEGGGLAAAVAYIPFALPFREGSVGVHTEYDLQHLCILTCRIFKCEVADGPRPKRSACFSETRLVWEVSILQMRRQAKGTQTE